MPSSRLDHARELVEESAKDIPGLQKEFQHLTVTGMPVDAGQSFQSTEASQPGRVRVIIEIASLFDRIEREADACAQIPSHFTFKLKSILEAGLRSALDYSARELFERYGDG